MNLFFYRVYGFAPKNYPAVTFTLKGYRDKLVRESNSGDRVVFAAVGGKKVAKHERNKLLGMVEIVPNAKDTNELMDISDTNAFPLDKKGNPRFSYAVPIVKAWHFKNPPFTGEVLKSVYPRGGATIMTEEDKATILGLDVKKVEAFSEINVLPHEENEHTRLSPSRGPIPSAGARNYEMHNHEFDYVYWLQWGKQDVWKIGWAYDPQDRLKIINKNIPYVVTKENWSLVRKQKTELIAYKLEQKMIERLSKANIGGEMFKCSKKQFEEAWRDIVLADTDNN